MKSNYKEIKKFVEMGKELGCDEVLFQKNFQLIEPSENIDFTNDKKIIVEIAKIMQDPVFDDKSVDTTLIDEYRAYHSSVVSVYNRIFAELKGRITYLPIKLMYLLRNVFFASLG